MTYTLITLHETCLWRSLVPNESEGRPPLRPPPATRN